MKSALERKDSKLRAGQAWCYTIFYYNFVECLDGCVVTRVAEDGFLS